jgi:hypothetical protein
MIKTEKEGCSQCKQNLNGMQSGMVIVSVYILITAIYGNVKLFELVSTFFK